MKRLKRTPKAVDPNKANWEPDAAATEQQQFEIGDNVVETTFADTGVSQIVESTTINNDNANNNNNNNNDNDDDDGEFSDDSEIAGVTTEYD